jgi:hypothetical protein
MDLVQSCRGILATSYVWPTRSGSTAAEITCWDAEVDMYQILHVRILRHGAR